MRGVRGTDRGRGYGKQPGDRACMQFMRLSAQRHGHRAWEGPSGRFFVLHCGHAEVDGCGSSCAGRQEGGIGSTRAGVAEREPACNELAYITSGTFDSFFVMARRIKGTSHLSRGDPRSPPTRAEVSVAVGLVLLRR